MDSFRNLYIVLQSITTAFFNLSLHRINEKMLCSKISGKTLLYIPFNTRKASIKLQSIFYLKRGCHFVVNIDPFIQIKNS